MRHALVSAVKSILLVTLRRVAVKKAMGAWAVQAPRIARRQIWAVISKQDSVFITMELATLILMAMASVRQDLNAKSMDWLLLGR